MSPESDSAALRELAEAAGIAVAKDGDTMTLRDPWGTRITLTQ